MYDIPLFPSPFWRWVVAFLILVCFSLRHLLAEREKLLRHRYFLLIQRFSEWPASTVLSTWPCRPPAAINAVLVNSCTPIIIVVISWIMYRERLKFIQGLSGHDLALRVSC